LVLASILPLGYELFPPLLQIRLSALSLILAPLVIIYPWYRLCERLWGRFIRKIPPPEKEDRSRNTTVSKEKIRPRVRVTTPPLTTTKVKKEVEAKLALPPINKTPPQALPKKDLAKLLEDKSEVPIKVAENYSLVGSQITEQLAHFGIKGEVVASHSGPIVTLYEFRPEKGVKVGRITALQDELAMGLRASSIRVIAPIPGKDTVGVEVPNTIRQVVKLRELLEGSEFSASTSALTIAMGKDATGHPVVLDIANMPHLLIAGATGTGKSVCINAIILSLLSRASPEDLQLIMVDPKILELSVYNGIPHLRVPVVTDCRKAKVVLDWAVKEMERRYRLIQTLGVRNIDSYNAIARGEENDEVARKSKPKHKGGFSDGAEVVIPLPKILIIIDELADLMFQVGREIEECITRLAQKARAAGIHLLVATQRPSVDVVTGLIKANFPARVSFRVSSRIDSRTILDSMGAERLLGKGDMLLMTPGAGPLRRCHGAYVSDKEVLDLVTELKRGASPQYDTDLLQLCEKVTDQEGGDTSEGDDEFADAIYDKAVNYVLEKGQASTSMIQRVFRVGYNRAARIVDRMERDGIVGPMDGVKQRQVIGGGREELI
jgi:S-DNA-T family DNA segregation ATPase FtsK/SpoIIIE